MNYFKYLEGEPLSDEEIFRGLRQGVVRLKLFPYSCGSALKNIGIQPLLCYDRIIVSLLEGEQAKKLNMDSLAAIVFKLWLTLIEN